MLLKLSLWAVVFVVVMVSGCATPTIRERMANGEAYTSKTEAELDEAEAAMKAIEPQGAEKHLRRARKLFSNEDVSYFPERSMVGERLTQLETRLPSVKAERQRLDLDAAIMDQERKLTELKAVLTELWGDLNSKTPTIDVVRRAQRAVEGLERQLERQSDLELKDKGYLESARTLRKDLKNAAVVIRTAGLVAEFREEGLKTFEQAERQGKQYSRARNVSERLSVTRDAVESYASCAREISRQNSEVKSMFVWVGNKKRTVKSIAQECRNKSVVFSRALARATRERDSNHRRKFATLGRR